MEGRVKKGLVCVYGGRGVGVEEQGVGEGLVCVWGKERSISVCIGGGE